MIVSFAVLCGLISMIGLGLSGALSREPVRRFGSDRSLLWRGVATTALQIPLLVFFFPDDLSWYGVALAFLVGIIGYLPIYFFFRAMEHGKMGVVSPISKASSVITALLAMTVLGESFGMWKWAGAILVLVGVVMLSADFRDWKKPALTGSRSSIFFALLACFGWGVVMFSFRYPILLIGPIATSFIVELSIPIVAALRLRTERKPLSIPKGNGKVFFLIGLASVIGGVAYDFGLSTHEVGLVAMLNMANPLVVAAYGRIVFKEKLLVRQFLGMILVIIGATTVVAL